MSGHSDEHAHGHRDASVRRLVVVLGITVAILLVEVVGALISSSLALLADAGHLLTDAAGLTVAVLAAGLMRRPATDRRTWGYLRAEVLAATLQAAVLLAVGVFVLVEAVVRLVHPPAVLPAPMIVFGVVGLLGNAISLRVLAAGGRDSLNTRAAFLEVASDALGAAAVIIAAVVIAVSGWQRADPLVSLLIGALILPRTLRLLREAVSVLLETVPKDLDLTAIRSHLLGVPRVRSVHDLHVSQISTGVPVLTAHVVVDEDCFRDGGAPALLDRLQECLAGHFPVSVEHSTFQLEPDGHAGHEVGTHH